MNPEMDFDQIEDEIKKFCEDLEELFDAKSEGVE